MSRGWFTLGEMGDRFRLLAVRCGNCPRSGRLLIDKPIDQYGFGMTLSDLQDHLADDCEYRIAARRSDRRQVYFP